MVVLSNMWYSVMSVKGWYAYGKSLILFVESGFTIKGKGNVLKLTVTLDRLVFIATITLFVVELMLLISTSLCFLYK